MRTSLHVLAFTVVNLLALAGCATTQEYKSEIVSPVPPGAMEEFLAREKQEEAEAQAHAKAKADLAIHDLAMQHGWNEQVKTAVREKHIIVGMPREAVELVWGKPTDRTRSGGIGGETETWTYRKAGYRYDVMYFVGGKLARWRIDE